MKTRRVVYCVAAVLCWGVLVLAPPVAAEGEPTAEEDALIEEPEEASPGDAQAYFDKGAQLYYEGKYSRAIVEFRKAHNIHPHPMFSYNIARANLNLDRIADANEAATEAIELEDQLPPEIASTNRALVASTQTILHGEEIAERIEQRRVAEPDEPVESDDDPLLSPLGWAGVAGLGLGVAALGGAGYVNVEVQNQRQALEEVANQISEDEFERQRDDIVQWQNRGRILLFSGIGLAAVGGGLLVWDLLDDGDDDGGWAVAPTLDRPGMNVLIRW